MKNQLSITDKTCALLVERTAARMAFADHRDEQEFYRGLFFIVDEAIPRCDARGAAARDGTTAGGVAVLTVKQAAERLGVSPALVYALCARRRLRHERHGLGRGKILIPEEALEEYRRRQTVDAEEEGVLTRPPPSEQRSQAAGPFTMLDSGRLLEAWRRQGVLSDPPGGGSAPSSG